MFINPLSLGLIIHIIDFVIRVTQNRIDIPETIYLDSLKKQNRKKKQNR